MCASALFNGLSKQECMQIASCARHRTFAQDELLFLQGQPARQLVLLETGSVKLTQLSANGYEALLWMNGAGDAVGVLPESSSCSHTCSARAMEMCNALTWEQKEFGDLLTSYPQIRKNINQIISSRLNELEERFREVATERVAQRLAMTLIRMAKKIGKPRHGGTEIALSREELAQMNGTTLFTISRILSKWGEERIVLPRREAVVVLDAARLELAGQTTD